MAKIIVIGHGGYACGIKENVSMLVGELPDFSFLDLKKGMDISQFKEELEEIIKGIGNEEIVICADILGGSPFQTAGFIAAENTNVQVVTGINTAGYCEASFNTSLAKEELAKLLIETSKEGLLAFPEV